MGRLPAAVASIAALLSASVPVRAESPCDSTGPGRATGPVAVGLLDGSLARPRRVCPRSEVALAGDGYVVADLARFYGNIRFDALVESSYAVSETTEVFASFGALRYQTVISAVSAAYVGTGYLSLGAMQQVLRFEGGVLGFWGRAVLPTTSGLDRSSWPLGGDLGLTVSYRAHATVDLHGSLVAGGSIGVSAGPALPRGIVRLAGAADWHPLRWLAVALELGAGFGYRGPLDDLSASLALRFAPVAGLGVELAATYPILGAERALLAGFLRLSWRFEGGPRRALDGAGLAADEPADEPPAGSDPEIVLDPTEAGTAEPPEPPADETDPTPAPPLDEATVEGPADDEPPVGLDQEAGRSTHVILRVCQPAFFVARRSHSPAMLRSSRLECAPASCAI